MTGCTFSNVLYSTQVFLNSLQNNKILARFKLKALADDSLKLVQMAESVLDREENILGKVENADHQSPTVFSKSFIQSLKLGVDY